MRLFTHYDTLQIAETASDEVIRGAYRHLANRWHPDKNASNVEEAARTMRSINEAFQVLSEPNRRREYDRWLAEQRDSQSAKPSSTDEGLTSERRGQMVRALSENRVRWMELGAGWLGLIIVLWATDHGLALGYGLLATIGAVLLSESFRRPALTAAHNWWAGQSAAYLQDRYDRFLSLRVIHVGARGIGIVIALLAIWGGIFEPWVRQRKNGKVLTASEAVQSGGVRERSSAAAGRPVAPSAGASAPLAPSPYPDPPFKIRVANRCEREVRLAINYLPIGGDWATMAWYRLRSGEEFDLKTTNGLPLLTENNILYYYAVSTDNDLVWQGAPTGTDDRTFNVEGTAHRFVYRKRAADESPILLAFTCR